MIADHQPPMPMFGLVPPVIFQVYRGGHATMPEGVSVQMGYGPLPLFGGPDCTVSYSKLTPYAKKIGVLRITNVWCP